MSKHDDKIIPIANLDTHLERDASNLDLDYLRREVAYLRGEIARHKEAIRQKDVALKEAIDTWRLILDVKESPTLGRAQMHVRRLETAYEYEGPKLTGAYEPLFRAVRKDKRWKKK